MELTERQIAIAALSLAAVALAVALYSASELERVNLERARAGRFLAEELERIERIANDAHWGPLGVPPSSKRSRKAALPLKAARKKR